MSTQENVKNSPTLGHSLKDYKINAGDSVLIRIPNGDIRSIKVEKDSPISVGKIGPFFANELISQVYGLTHEVVNKKLRVIPPQTIKEVDDTDATNELINDGEFVQPLTVDEIQTLRQSGVHASDIIKKQIEQHANYSLKTEYSKEKYRKRKEAKYSKTFTTIEPTLYNVCEYWFAKDQNRLRDIRIDTLSQMMNLVNIRPGGRYIAVDDASGLVVSGILERMGGEGRLLTICDSESPPAYPVMTNMNFSSSITNVLVSLNWATAEEEYTPVMPPSELPADQLKSDRQRFRLNKRKAANELLMSTREELFSGEFDGLIIASEYDPYSIIERLSPYLGGSACIVVHSPHVQVLADLQSRLRSLPEFLCPSVTESWLRKYQVLPGRTHPLMSMSGSGGFILHTTKVYDDTSASYVLTHKRQKAKKASADPELKEQEGEGTPW